MNPYLATLALHAHMVRAGVDTSRGFNRAWSDFMARELPAATVNAARDAYVLACYANVKQAPTTVWV